MRAQVFTMMFRVGAVLSDRIELVVTHDGLRAAGIDHSPNRHQTVNLTRSTVNEVADKYGGAIWMPISTVRINVTQVIEQGVKLVRLPMNVANDVVSHSYLPLLVSVIM